MSILLNCDEIYEASSHEARHADMPFYQDVTKAQLKNVRDKIKRNSYVALDKRTGEVKLGSIIIPPEFWQDLLKECE